jgi:two-component system OmpR family sensor kinase
MKWWGWILVLFPAGVGLLISGLAVNEIIKDPVLFMRGSLSALALRGGLTISLIAFAAALYLDRSWKKQKAHIQETQKKADEERRRFLQRLDHELKNPLTAIRTGLSNIDHSITEEDLKEEVTAVKAQVLRISRLVADLRKLAALETTPIEETEVNMSEILNEVVTVVQAQPNFGGRKLSLVTPNAPWPLPTVKGDPDLLLLAVHNLLDNAIKFTSPEDTIEVRAYEDGGEIVIEVADTGPGIPESEIDHVWNELYRGEQARGVPGSGLGLPLVRAIIEMHGGKAVLRSRSRQGTVFNIRLPVK